MNPNDNNISLGPSGLFAPQAPFQSLNAQSNGLFKSGSTIGLTLLDEDDFSSNADNRAATQQSIKAYVDSRSDSISRTAQGVDLAINYNTTNNAGIVATFSNEDLAAEYGAFTSTNQTITTNYTGRVRLDAVIPHTSTGQRASLEGWIEKNGVKVSAKVTAYIRNANGDNEATLQMFKTVSCQPGDVFRVKLKREQGTNRPEAINMNDLPTFEANRF